MTVWAKLGVAHKAAARKNVEAGAWVTTPAAESAPLREARIEREAAEAAGDVESIIVLRARESRIRERLEESLNWREGLHPRSRLGRWMEKFGDRIAPPTTLGTTPYLKSEHRRLAPADGDFPRATFGEAEALHRDPRFNALFRTYERRAEALAREHNVRITGAERNVGVFKGSYEPSYAIRARGKEADIDAFNETLGREFNQEAVVSFTPDRSGEDREVRVAAEGADADEFTRDVSAAYHEVYGEDGAGVSYDKGLWRVFVQGPESGSPDFDEVIVKRNRFAHLVARLGRDSYIVNGRGNYIPTGGTDS